MSYVSAGAIHAVNSLMCTDLARRSFYPLFPAPQMPGGDYQVALDMTHAELLSISENGPDVMILPSRLKTFSKVRHCFHLSVLSQSSRGWRRLSTRP